MRERSFIGGFDIRSFHWSFQKRVVCGIVLLLRNFYSRSFMSAHFPSTPLTADACQSRRQPSSASTSVEPSDQELGCGAPDTYIADLIAEARKHPDAQVIINPQPRRYISTLKFDPWEAPHD